MSQMFFLYISAGLDIINKDHQRIMVDPMFMIVQSLRSYLTAVTPTAVTPTAVTPAFYLNLPEFT